MFGSRIAAPAASFPLQCRFQFFNVSKILRSPAGALIRNQIGYGYNRNFQSFQENAFPIGVSMLEFDAANVGNDVYSAWAIADLKDDTGG